jgi:ubiquinone/menaquinone biosynthesis C-methylase UbiE
VTFEVGEGHTLPYPDASFDAVIAHTTVSHVTDPVAVLREAALVVRPKGRVAVFDGDYASWTFDHPDQDAARAMEEALIAAVVGNPRILR